MCKRYYFLTIFSILCLLPVLKCHAAANENDNPGNLPAKVYVPYEELKNVFENENQGVFLPYRDFQKLWQAAQGKPADVSQAPFEYLISTARFDGNVNEEIASIKLELTIDILSKDWVEVPIGLGSAAVSKANLINLDDNDNPVEPLIRVVNGQYIFTVKGAGRYILELDFVRQLETQPGLAVLEFSLPSASITTTPPTSARPSSSRSITTT